MRNVRNLRKSALLAAFLCLAAACSSGSPRWTDGTGESPIEPAPGGGKGGGGQGTGPTDAAGGGGEDGRAPQGTDGSTPPPPPPPSDAGPGPDSVDAAIYATPVECSSGTTWTQGNTGTANMQPGSACRTCHVIGGSASGKTWDIAGTVYPTAHEPDNCNGTSMSGVAIVITDATGAQTSIAVNGVGNFYHADLFGFAKIPTPYTAKVVYGGKERVMFTPQTEGDCNSCHTESGAKSAPGRIMLP
jgi:hypothetical protein